MTEFLAAHSPELFTVFFVTFMAVLAFPVLAFLIRAWRGQ